MVQSKYFDRIVLISLVCLQAFMASACYFREIAWYPAPHWDQSNFLRQAYSLEERVFTHGPLELVKALWDNTDVNGLLLPIEGALSGAVFGGTRFPQLLVNFMFFIGLQLFAFNVGKRTFGNRGYGYLLLGLILCEASPWYWSGGLFDFRQDFSAYCLYGAWVCAVLRSRTFAERRWSIAAGAIAAFLVLHRYLTIVYLTAVLGSVIVLFVALILIWRAKPALAGPIRDRLSNSVFSILVLFLGSLPFLIRNREALYNYYVVGHLLSGQKTVRAAESGVFNLLDHLLFYPRSLMFSHLGATFVWAAVIAVALASLAFAMGRLDKQDNDAIAPGPAPFYGIAFLLIAILLPMAILTSDTAKSPCVVNIVGVPVALLVVSLAALLFSQLSRSWTPKLVGLAAGLVMLLGLYNEVFFLTEHLPDYPLRADYKRFGELDTWLVTYASERNWRNPKISFDGFFDLMQSWVIESTGYEQTGELINFQTKLARDIMSISRQDVFSLLADSDIVVLTTKPKNGVYPFWESIRQVWPDMKSWCDLNMDIVKTEKFSDFTATVYVRRGS